MASPPPTTRFPGTAGGRASWPLAALNAQGPGATIAVEHAASTNRPHLPARPTRSHASPGASCEAGSISAAGRSSPPTFYPGSSHEAL
jgi:hypothetical protein